MENLIYKQGEKCSRNFIFKKKVESINELMIILENQPSIFWNHRVYPCAVVMQQKLVVIKSAIKYGMVWEIEKIQGGKNEQQ